MANRMRSAAKERFWRSKLRRFEKRGSSVREFCRSEGLSEPSFYAWRKVIEERDAQRPIRQVPAFLPLRVQESQAVHPASSGNGARESAVTLELRGGRRLRLPDSMPAARFAELIRALEAVETSS